MRTKNPVIGTAIAIGITAFKTLLPSLLAFQTEFVLVGRLVAAVVIDAETQYGVSRYP
jgi:hypothetical protein